MGDAGGDTRNTQDAKDTPGGQDKQDHHDKQKNHQDKQGEGNEPRPGPLRRWRARAVTGVALLAVLAGAGAIGQQVKTAKEEKSVPPAGASGVGGLSVPRKAPGPPVTVTVYEDLRSAASRAFAERFGETLDAMAATGQVRVEHRLVTGTDTRLGGRGSAEAAAAAACAQDEDRFEEYVAVLYRDQPAEDDDAFGSRARLTRLASRVPDIDPAVFRPCVRVGRHEGWVRASQTEFAESGLGGAPALTIDGKPVATDPAALTPGGLRRLVRTAVRDSGRDW